MTISWAAYSVVSAYVASGLVGYVAARPGKGIRLDRMKLYQGPFAESIANAVQSVNFTASRIRGRKQKKPQNISQLYHDAVHTAFNPNLQFIVTGAPHARAYYLRNFACFYPDLLDPISIVDHADAEHRRLLLERSVAIMIASLEKGIQTTTLVPVSRNRIVGVNYFNEPSDTLLGILYAIRQLSEAGSHPEYADVFEHAAAFGRSILEKHHVVLEEAVLDLAKSLELAEIDGQQYLLCDFARSRSSATDTRADRMRFVTNANIWTTFYQAVALGIVSEDALHSVIGISLQEYKDSILSLFGRRGYIEHSLENKSTDPALSVSLDFAHLHRGFWYLNSERERRLFKATADIILSDARLKVANGSLYLMSARRAKQKMLHLVTASEYQGRAAWPSFNVEFADRLFELGSIEGDARYIDAAKMILRTIRVVTETYGGYQEVLSQKCKPYRTWMYKSAIANSWFPRYASVWHRAFNEKLCDTRLPILKIDFERSMTGQAS